MGLESIVDKSPAKLRILEALQILVEEDVFGELIRANTNQLVDGRTDSHDEEAIAREVREIRQTNRILLGLENSARSILEGVNYEG